MNPPLPSFDSSWESLAFLGSLIVIVGVVFECIELLVKSSKNNWCRKLGKRLIWHSNDRRILMQLIHWVETFDLVIEVVGFVLVVAGLGMELYGGTKALLTSDAENRQLRIELSDSIDARLQIEAVLLPRRYRQQSQSEERLKEYAGVKFLILTQSGIYSQDPSGNVIITSEQQGIAHQVYNVLKGADWLPISPNDEDAKRYIETPFASNLFDGITVEWALEHFSRKEGPAATALVNELNKRRINARTMPESGRNPPNILAIKIGNKPDFSEMQMMELEKAMDESTNHSQKRDLMERIRDAMP